MRILVTGSSGFIGSELLIGLGGAGREVVGLRRGSQWDPSRGILDPSVLTGVDAVINLAGENLFAGRWNQRQKDRIRQSRVLGTRLIVDRLLSINHRPLTLLSASAVGFYGDCASAFVSEDSPNGQGFLADVCREWELEALRAEEGGVRVILIRLGVVLKATGGMLGRLLPVFRLGLGGALGRGDQYVSWISMEDAVGAIALALDNDGVSGPVNLVSPNPVTNLELTRSIGQVLRRPTIMKVPAPVLRAVLGREAANEALLASTRALPGKLVNAGYRFRFPSLEDALRHALDETV